MDFIWLKELFLKDSVAHAVLIISLVSLVGLAFGKVKIFGIVFDLETSLSNGFSLFFDDGSLRLSILGFVLKKLSFCLISFGSPIEIFLNLLVAFFVVFTMTA